MCVTLLAKGICKRLHLSDKQKYEHSTQVQDD